MMILSKYLYAINRFESNDNNAYYSLGNWNSYAKWLSIIENARVVFNEFQLKQNIELCFNDISTGCLLAYLIEF